MMSAELRGQASRIGILAATILLTWGALLIGRLTEEIHLEVGDRSPQNFFAPESMTVVDEQATAQARENAYNNEPSVYTLNPEVTNTVIQDIAAFFVRVQEIAQPPPPEGSTATTQPAPITTAPPPPAEEEAAAPTTTVPATTTTSTLPPPPPVEEQIEALGREFALPVTTLETVVVLANDPEHGGTYLQELRDESVRVAQDFLEGAIRPGELNSEIRPRLQSNPPFVFLPLQLADQTDIVSRAVADVVDEFLQANETLDETATEEAREAARDAVPEITQTYDFGERIVSEGEPVETLELAALQQAGLLRRPGGLSSLALLAMVGVLVAVLSFYLARFRPDFWVRPKRVVLFGLLIVLSALAARAVAVLLVPTNVSLGYLVPAAAFGFMAAILFDARMAVVTSVAVGALTGLATYDPSMLTGSLGYTLFALLATLVPVPFVSAISARADFRRAVGYSGLALAPIAGSIAWLFHGQSAGMEAIGWGLLNAAASGIIAQGLLPFLENLFDITTSFTLLDLTDRNHPALRLLEEEARGTFNHSLMVGTLADRGARAIGANPLLARAAAYYHDLGKTEDPAFFIENQFGGHNPHDSMLPEESAAIIRQHVEDGRRLARQYRIPSEVAEGVLAHHGTGLMRYFYHKAMDRYGENVEPEQYRHRGHKPHTAEMTILMLADAVEGACRALVLHEDPTAEGIRRTIDRVVAEKQADGQLDESALSLGELKAVRDAFASALIGHYHQRIPYPDFPEPPSEAEPVREPVPPAEVSRPSVWERPTRTRPSFGDGFSSVVMVVVGVALVLITWAVVAAL
ncbi:MAG: HD family phosphohydrolase [Acidimicrobiia bacterium]